MSLCSIQGCISVFQVKMRMTEKLSQITRQYTSWCSKQVLLSNIMQSFCQTRTRKRKGSTEILILEKSLNYINF